MHVVVVIPAYNEAHTVSEVVRNVRAHVPDVIVVDDGSDDTTGDRARHAGARVITHCVNRGLGAALGTGIAAALGRRPGSPSLRVREGWGGLRGKGWGELRNARNPLNPPYPKGEAVEERADIIVTLDADGQHDPADIPAVIAPIQAGFADLVIGTRWKNFSPSPRRGEGEREGERSTIRTVRSMENRIANLLTHLLFGIRCSDTQSGFRAFSRRAASLIEIRTNRMEVSSEILAEAARLSLRVAEVPIRTIYTEYSLSKGQGVVTGARTAWSLILRRFF